LIIGGDKMKNLTLGELKRKLSKQPNHLLANKLVGAYYAEKGQFLESVQYYSKVVTLEQNADNFYNLGVVLHHLKKYSDAEEMYLEALKLEPNRSEIYSNLGGIFRDQQKFNQSLAFYQKAIDLAPDKLIEFSNFFLVLIDLKKYQDALEIIEYMISKSSTNEVFYIQKYDCLKILGLEKESESLLYKLLDLFPSSYKVQWLFAQHLLSVGDYLQGWKIYESRWLVNFASLKKPIFDKPLWLGDFSIKGQTLLVHSEQGLGDTIQFCRYVEKLSFADAKIIFVLPKSLLTILSHLKAFCLMIEDGTPLPDYDAHVPLMSLPLVLSTTLEDIPNSTPYIFADPIKSISWRNILQSEKQLKVGLIWSGGHRPDHPESFAMNERRNLPVEMFMHLKGLDISFFSLQKGEPAESDFALKVTNDWGGPPIQSHVALIQDFSDTAALIDNLDLVISVDTSTAHLAAAMGKPVWLLNRLDSDWRWLKHRIDSPWYPTLKIFRQTKPNDWVEVMENVRQELLEMTSIDKT
jgi:tetratricopeptide (TPR) repeat protein